MKTAKATDAFVVDASAMAKTIVLEEHSQAFRAWLQAALDASQSMLAPPLLRYELGNVLANQARRDPAMEAALREHILHDALLGFRFADPQGTETFAPPLTYYDASYLALAKATKATLVSYDKALLEAAKKARIKTLTPKD